MKGHNGPQPSSRAKAWMARRNGSDRRIHAVRPEGASLSDSRPKRPLDPAAVKAANERLWAEFPELKGRQLTMSESDHKYRCAWREAYQGEVEKKTCPK